MSVTVTLAQVDAYFTTHPKSATWIGFSTDSRSKAVAQAVRILEPFQDVAVDSTLLYAVSEQSLWLLQADARAELQQAGVQGFSLGNMSEQFNSRGRPSHIAPMAWAYLRGGTGVKVGQFA